MRRCTVEWKACLAFSCCTKRDTSQHPRPSSNKLRAYHLPLAIECEKVDLDA